MLRRRVLAAMAAFLAASVRRTLPTVATHPTKEVAAGPMALESLEAFHVGGNEVAVKGKNVGEVLV